MSKGESLANLLKYRLGNGIGCPQQAVNVGNHNTMHKAINGETYTLRSNLDPPHGTCLKGGQCERGARARGRRPIAPYMGHWREEHVVGANAGFRQPVGRLTQHLGV